MNKMIAALAGVAAAGIFATGSAQAAETLDAVKGRGELVCGVSTGLPGFSVPDDKGAWTGIDVDTCRAVAAAVLGDANKVKFVPLTAKERFTALQSGEIDMLSRNTTWTATRDTSLGLNFAGVNYYDGQGFMVMKSLGVKSAKELSGASVCIQSGTTTELNLADYFRLNGMEYSSVVFDTSDQTIQGFEAGRCDMLTSDQSQLYSLRTKLPDPSAAMVLPEVISKEPLGPVVRQGDDEWFNIVKWSLFAMVNAEEFGITSANVDEMKDSKDPNVGRLLGTQDELGPQMGLDKEWAYNIVKQVGNYSEMFERTVGMGSPLEIARGLNALWSNGGIMYAPPAR
ncbi:MAG: amino acid ABC transporter substrate-binding protein [Rhodospirillum sp.]|nr:amino acid ABC transporter substrate-binding protein [Rhodospirillum sp.]MCF8488207.1 amino acid ABC transporter substrate-binding protein [Rhodospirillum sp.]MCF8501198.1 amino acid ABC transporter substrate-binding protein [Rhodospirillum sp.]